jgi:GNAT superfamily N-acetyltransferase
MAGSAKPPVITVTEIDGDDADEVAEFYRRVLAPHFTPDELEGAESFADGVRHGGTNALAARTPDGTIVGGAVGDWFQESRVLLLSYLAVAVEGRGSGTGGLLMKTVIETWGGQFSPSLLIMEVEDPRHHHVDVNFGDPRARVRFYERLGARTLPVPYFQPALSSRGPDARRVPHLLLMVFGGIEAPPGTQRVDGRTVEVFLTEYLEGCEGPVRPDDHDAQRLLAACRRPGGLPLVLVSELPPAELGYA